MYGTNFMSQNSLSSKVSPKKSNMPQTANVSYAGNSDGDGAVSQIKQFLG